jgi:hypothetical protein
MQVSMRGGSKVRETRETLETSDSEVADDFAAASAATTVTLQRCALT